MSQLHRIVEAARTVHGDLESGGKAALSDQVRDLDLLVRLLDDGNGRLCSEAHTRLCLSLRLIEDPDTGTDTLVDQWTKAHALRNAADELH